MSLQDQLLDVERSLWSSDPLAYERNVIEEAVFVFAETGTIGRDMAIDAIRQQAASGDGWSNLRIGNAIALTLGADAAVLTYRASAMRKGQSVTVLATSAYVRRGGDWKLALHHQTKVG